MERLSPYFKNKACHFFLFLFFTVIILWGVLFFISKKSLHLAKSASIQIGSTLPDFQLKDLQEHSYWFSKLPDRLFLIHFWASWCEACMAEMPSLVHLRKQLKPQGVEVLGINLDEDPEIIIPESIKSFGISFPIFKNEGGNLSEFFNVYAIPLTLILNRERKILFIKNGEENWSSPTLYQQITKWASE